MFGGILFSKSTHGGVRSEKLDKMITDARRTTDPKAQVKKYQELNRYVRENALLAFLYHLDEIVGKKKNVDWAPRSSGWDIPSEIGWKK
jgi:ABC-type oligopeptide transport system substrate-binding subunit